MKASEILRQKMVLKHESSDRLAIFEIVVWQVLRSNDYPNGVKYRAWFSEKGKTLFGFDNHKPKRPHLHVRDTEVAYTFLGLDELRADVISMIRKEGFIYEE
jgi:Family of unknown function (DUF6516)